MASPEIASDRSQYTEMARRYKWLEPIIAGFGELELCESDLEVATELLADATGADAEELHQDLREGETRRAELLDELLVLMTPPDPNEGRNVIVEIRGAEGGEEANLFAGDLFAMYKAFASSEGWKFEMLGSHLSDMGGFSEVTFLLKGEGVWTRMQFEGGPHRVQRVPVTESQGRVHTSSATVTVLPEADEVDVELDHNELQFDTYRSSGPGGQSVNTTDSAVRVTHLPSGTVVSMQDEKSQIQNRAKALRVLRSRLLKMEQDRQAAEASEQRKDQLGGGGRSEKIRTYNFKENRVSDHRIGLTVYNLDKVLAGELSEVSDALVAHDAAERLTEMAAGEDSGLV
jgi:peptide chain release factor 1